MRPASETTEWIDLVYDRTLSGQAIVLPGFHPQNPARKVLLGVAAELRRMALSEDVAASPFLEVLAFARALQREVKNPVHYGENTPGLYAEGRIRVPEVDCFTCSDLFDYGSTGEGGFSAFCEAIGVDANTTEFVAHLGVVLATLDEAVTAFDAGKNILGAHISAQAAEAVSAARAASLRPALAYAEVMRKGRKQGTIGSVRLAIRAALAKNANRSAEQLWADMSKKPPKNLAFFNSPRLGRYIEWSTSPPRSTAYDRFANLVSEEKRLLRDKGSRISEPVKPR